jgi:hypothetical protein
VIGSNFVPHYCIYFIERDGHAIRPPEIIECADDQEAIPKAKQSVDAQDVELWDGPRFVRGFPHGPKNNE